jgi:hypothetical protein
MDLVKSSIRIFVPRVECIILMDKACSRFDLIARIMRDNERNVPIAEVHLQFNTGAVIHVRRSQSFPSTSMEFLLLCP